MGSKSFSTSTTNVTDKRQVTEAGAVGVSADHSTVNMLDGGAVDRAFDFAEFSSGKFSDSFEKLLGMAGKTLDLSGETAKFAEKAADAATSKIAEAYEGASGQKTMLYGALVLAGLWLLRKKGA